MGLSLYDYIKRDSNIKLADLSNKELKDFLYLNAQTPIEYKEKLDFSSDIPFGIEIEFEWATYYNVLKDLQKRFGKIDVIDNREIDMKYYDYWSIEHEDNVTYYNDFNELAGGELNSPISYNNVSFFNDLADICKILRKNNAKNFENSGIHIHANKCVLEKSLKSYLNFIKLWIIFEDEFLKMYMGELDHMRAISSIYSKNMADTLYYYVFSKAKIKTIKQLLNVLDLGRMYTLAVATPKKGNSTIELRACNGTTNEIIIQQYLNIYMHTLLVANDKKNNEWIDELFQEYENQTLFIDKYVILKLIDEMFNNIEDKASALRLYYKDNRYSNLTAL